MEMDKNVNGKEWKNQMEKTAIIYICSNNKSDAFCLNNRR